jgi:hypothetical protein
VLLKHWAKLGDDDDDAYKIKKTRKQKNQFLLHIREQEACTKGYIGLRYMTIVELDSKRKFYSYIHD